ncbi:MAG: hypothetical protein DHS20C08_18780 [Rhodomicrobium sp.]|nr:MAG: hypothetical protein DHS20C08_18780 [Rhodomicrobium sp.]
MTTIPSPDGTAFARLYSGFHTLPFYSYEPVSDGLGFDASEPQLGKVLPRSVLDLI